MIGHMAHDGGDAGAGFHPVVRHVDDEIGRLRELHQEQVGETGAVQTMQRPHAVAPRRGELLAALANRIETGAFFGGGADFEPGGVDDAVHFIVLAVHPQAGFVDSLDTLAIGVNQGDAGPVEGLQILIMEAGPLAQLAIPGLQRLAGLAVFHHRHRAGADLLHLVMIGHFPGRHHVFRVPFAGRQAHHPAADAARQVGPAILHPVFRRAAHTDIAGKVFQPARLPARRGDGFEPVGINGFIGAHVHA